MGLKNYTVKKAWREIAEFPSYEMSSMAEIREKLSGRILTPGYNNKGHHYHLLEGGKVYARSSASLLADAYPELVEANRNWRSIPEFADYQIASNGHIRSRKTLLVVQTMSDQSGQFCRTIDGARKRVSMRLLRNRAFPELKAL